MNSPGEITDAQPRPHRGDDLDSASIARLAVIFVVTLACCLIMVAFLFRYFERLYPHRTSEAQPRVSTTDLPPQPRPQTLPAHDLEEVCAAEDRHLSRYAWINHGQGIAQIPIDRAMTLWVQTYGGATATNPAPAASAFSMTNAPAAIAMPITHAAPTGVTELQMRQEKGEEARHAP